MQKRGWLLDFRLKFCCLSIYLCLMLAVLTSSSKKYTWHKREREGEGENRSGGFFFLHQNLQLYVRRTRRRRNCAKNVVGLTFGRSGDLLLSLANHQSWSRWLERNRRDTRSTACANCRVQNHLRSRQRRCQKLSRFVAQK